MKRKLAGLLTALMVLAMGTTAFAAGTGSSVTSGDVKPSGSTSSSQTPGTSTTTPATPTGTTEVTPVSQAVKDAAESVARSVSPDAQVMAVVDVTYDGVIPAGGVQLSFSLAGVQAGDNYVLLHQLADGRWEMITPDSVENGVIKATFTSLSPVAFVKLPSAQNNGTVNGTNGTSTKPSGTTTSTSSTAAGTSAASPKTGAALPVLPVLAMICVAGIVVCGRKVKFNA